MCLWESSCKGWHGTDEILDGFKEMSVYMLHAEGPKEDFSLPQTDNLTVFYLTKVLSFGLASRNSCGKRGTEALTSSFFIAS